jgi:8-amino-3,8-dideoxy-alpha-D-manno-octulosonate transaminase
VPGFEVIGDEERAAVNELFDEGGILFAHGFDAMRKHFHVREFEQALADRLGARYGLAVTSGTAATMVALKAVGIRPGDEVITQAFNFVATIEAILECGAIPIIANVDDTLNMDPVDLERRITPRTRAVVPVHMLGVPVDMDPVLEIARSNGLAVVEDVCEALGATYKGWALGSLGDAAAVSLDFGKVITCGEGGVVLTATAEADRIAREYHDHGHESNPKLPRGRDTKSTSGFNYRMTEMQAVVAKAQLAKLDTIIDGNRARFEALAQAFADAVPLRRIPEGAVPIYDTFIFHVGDAGARKDCTDLLAELGFGTKNLPDAMEWHCAAFWNHALTINEIEHAAATLTRLETAVAVPILLRRTVESYADLGGQLRSALRA